MEEMAMTTERDNTTSEVGHVERWLTKFETALVKCDRKALSSLFVQDCHWRDILAFTWNITPHEGLDAVVERLVQTQPSIQACNFKIASNRTPPRKVRRVGTELIEAIFQFETSLARGYGVLRLRVSEPEKAWIIMTSLKELKGYEEPINERRPSGAAYSREFGGANWADRRAKEQSYADRDPAVLIIGAGQAGLMTAARLRLMGVECLCVDKLERVGDVWRKRYHSLALHNQTALNHMAYMPFPPSWPKYLPKDMLANWIENYAWAMECNVWTGTTFVGAEYDDSTRHWNARVLRADGTERVLRPRHLLFANGIVGAPKIPKLPGLDDFQGSLEHTHSFKDGAKWRGKNALIIGTGTSGHDIAQDLYSHGANVNMIQRGPVTIVSLQSANMSHSLHYDEGLPLEDADLILTTNTYPIAVSNAKALTKRQNENDKDLLAALASRGLKMDIGEDETGYVMKVRRIHAGYYINCGCSDLIADGKIGVIQHERIDRFVADGVRLKDGSHLKADLIVAATGYQSQLDVVRELLGDSIADKVGPIWGIAPDGELNNMFRPTAQKGLWFIGSSFAQSRLYSHVIALQIRAREAGLIRD